MKQNLKNRPVKANPQAYERFLKDMEKEFRDELEEFKTAKADKEHTSGLTQFGMGIEFKIKEILGDVG